MKNIRRQVLHYIDVAKQTSYSGYYIYDTFSVGGNYSDNGKYRDIVDPNGAISFSGGAIQFADSSNNWDTGIRYPALSVTKGLLLKSSYTRTSGILQIGFADTIPNTLGYVTIRNSVRIKGTATDYGVYSAISSGEFCLSHSNTGIYVFIKSGSDWLLLFRSESLISTEQNVLTIYSYNATMAVDYVKVPKKLWIPEPYISDGFSTLSESDGLGHAEGILGGLGSGGNGKVWVNFVNTFAIVSGKIKTVSAGRGIRIVDSLTPNNLISANIYLVTGTVSIVVRWIDESNYIQLRKTSTHIQLVKTVSAVDTTIYQNTVTYVDGAKLMMYVNGTKFRMYYNDEIFGSEQTITDAVLQTSSTIGIRSDDVNNTIDNFVVHSVKSSVYNDNIDSF